MDPKIEDIQYALSHNETFLELSVVMLLTTLTIGVLIGCLASRGNPRDNDQFRVRDRSESEDDENVGYDYRNKKAQPKRIWIAVLLTFFAIVAAGYMIAGALALPSKNNTAAVNRSADKVLPDATVTIETESEIELSGEISFFEADIINDLIAFEWASVVNQDDALFRFVANSDAVPGAYLGVLNGFTGVELSVNSLVKPQDYAAATDPNNEVTLRIELFRVRTSTIVELSPQDELSAADQALLRNIVNGRIGEYINALSIKLGAMGHLGFNEVPVNAIHHFARFLNTMASKTRADATLNHWRWNNLDTAVSETNKLLSEIQVSHAGGDVSVVKQSEVPAVEEDERRRLQLSGCSASNWWYLGDGYCDSSLNTAACNWDNGDCCEHTCSSGVNWEDNDGVSYSGYTCGSGSGYDCLDGYSGCSVANPSWLGDGWCDGGDYNTEACGYDLGDCCSDACKPGAYACGSNGYNCLDSSDNWCSRS
eukprot:CAMPEP_0202733338 /NCGR_PEP_ID=MMETSP1385-20130828/188116_1 /ASSEMBLY_ACC=CAM_ASM_000861 /TAXON_ID=933848 /ORGANISM="Elphidium margaritaceum" /LENGTH=481 /DNA_ID=CAMNT_0049399667 /DNA_START=94 /DNA_END=1536 /DNA_ORIENTATION=-